tara:strand:+ start:17 stop:445 length:429 start_codon:yes stop_codon:yes gene_type:complete
MLASKIPEDVFRDQILPYTYCPQPIKLRDDIRSYYNTINNVHNIYSKAYPTSSVTPEGDTDKAWLSNDITRFLNNDQPTMLGYTKFHLQIYKRLYMNNSKDSAAIATNIGLHALDSCHIKIAVGLLSLTERCNLEAFLRGIH